MKNTIYFLLGLLISFILMGSANATLISCSDSQWFNDSKTTYSIGETGVIQSGTNYFKMVVVDQWTDSFCSASELPSWYQTVEGGIVYIIVSSRGASGCGGSEFNYTISRTITELGYAVNDSYEYSRCYTLPVSAPTTWSDGIKNADEDGIDCGGSNPTPCVSSCPPGSEELNGLDGQPGCFWYGLADNYGNCPPGATHATDIGFPNACYKQYDYVLAAENITPDAIAPPVFTNGTFSVVETVYPSSTVDNGDGTSTKTTTTEKTNSDGSSSSTTTTENIDNATGQVLSATTSQTGETAPEDNPENYDISGPEAPEYDSDLVAGEDYPEETDLETLLDSFQNNALVESINNSGLSLSSASCSISANLFNQDITISFCDSRIIEWLNVIGTLLVSITYLSTPFMIFGRG